MEDNYISCLVLVLRIHYEDPLFTLDKDVIKITLFNYIFYLYLIGADEYLNNKYMITNI